MTHAEAIQNGICTINQHGNPSAAYTIGRQRSIFKDGKYSHANGQQRDVLTGEVSIAHITHSPDVPQFKRNKAGRESDQSGVVYELPGEYRQHDPIHLWQRTDGTLVVISGRHRLAKAIQAGASYIPATVFPENAQRDTLWARMHDFEQNVLDNQASVADTAVYVAGTNPLNRKLTEKETQEFTRPGSNSELGTYIGLHGSDDLLYCLTRGFISPDYAHRIAKLAPDDADVQQQAIGALVQDGKGIQEAENSANIYREIRDSQTGELMFESDQQEEAFNRFLAKYAANKIREIGRAQRPHKAAKSERTIREHEAAGIKFEDASANRATLQQLTAEQEKWRHPRLHPECMEEARKAFDETDEAKQTYMDFDLFSDTPSMSIKAGTPTYTVINDNVGLQQHLDDIATPVEINFSPDSEKNWIKEAKKYLAQLAGKIYILENTDGYSVKMPDSHIGKATAVKGIRKTHQFKAEVINKFEELFRRVVLLNVEAPSHKENESEARAKRVDASAAFYKFGWPVRINGTLKMFWFGADQFKNANEKELAFYEFGLQDINEKGDSAVRSMHPKAEVKQGTESPSSEETLGDYLANVKLNPNKDRILPEIIKNTTSKHGTSVPTTATESPDLFTDGVLEAQNAIVTKPDVSFSIKAMHASPHNFRKFSTDFMSSGEGTQAYGWGIYFMTLEAINNYYITYFNKRKRKALFFKDKEINNFDLNHIIAQMLSEVGSNEYSAADWELLSRDGKPYGKTVKYWTDIWKRDGSFEKIAKETHDKLADYTAKHTDGDSFYNLTVNKLTRHAKIAQALNKAISYREIGRPVNYRVELNADDSNLLMWDSIIDRNTATEEMRSMIDKMTKHFKEVAFIDLYDFISSNSGTLLTPSALESIAEDCNIDEELSMPASNLASILQTRHEKIKEQLREAYTELSTAYNKNVDDDIKYWKQRRKQLMREHKHYRDLLDFLNGSVHGESFYRYLSRELGSDKDASLWLAKQGYKGIKFLDGNSRSAGEGTYNYVIFSGDDIKITAVNETGIWSMEEGWEEYTDPTANFSIRAANPSTLDRFTADPLGERIVHTVRTEARRYARVLGDKTPQEQAVNAIASAESIINAVDKYLHRPDKPISRRHRNQLTKLRSIIEKYAQIIASGTPRSLAEPNRPPKTASC